MFKKPIKLACFVLMLSHVLTIAGNAAQKPNLIGWWKFEGDLLDSSGLGNDGTAEGDPAFVAGKIGSNALELDGDDYVVIDGVADDVTSNNITFSGWVKTTDTHGLWLSSNGASGANVNKALWSIENGQAALYDGPNSAYEGSSSTNVSDGVWHLLTYVRSGSTGYIYVDGIQENTHTAEFNFSPTDRWSIGMEWDDLSAGDFLIGTLDDIRIYDRSLSADHVWDLFNGIEPAFVKAENPEPVDGAMLSDTWVSLGWSPGDTGASHDVYFGENFDDVNNGTGDTSRGNQTSMYFVAGFPGFPYPDGLVPGKTYYWRIDEVEANGTTRHKGDVWSFTIPSKIAYNPAPPDGVKFVDPNITLNWTAGFGAKLHTVYFGDNFTDVNNAVGGIPQTATTYRPFFGPLELDKIYYWRVDEFDAITTHKGQVWSFKTKPFIPIVDPNLIGWWKFDEGYGSTALDWSGHRNDGTLVNKPQWVEGHMDGALEFNGSNYVTMNDVADDITNNDITLSGWVKTNDSHGLWLSSNTATGNVALWAIDQGQATMYDGADSGYEGYSNTVVNDNEWHMLTYVRSGSTGYIYVDGVQENTHPAAYSFSATDRWSIGQEWDSGTPSDFLAGTVDDVRIYDMALTADEVKQLMRGDPLAAWDPSPRNKSTVDIKEARKPLRWSPGDETAQHDVYFGTDKEAVSNADVSDTVGIYRGRQGATNYTLSEGIEWGGGPYYWRIDEYNNDASISTGATWSFTVADYLIVDDFESYNDINEGEPASNRIYLAWLDGYDNPAINGSVVGYANPPFAEQTIVHSGSQSMPFAYDNAVGKSEATLTLTDTRDWTQEGVGVLSLWFYGDTSNAAEPMYVVLNGNAVVQHDNPNAALINDWTEWSIDLQAFGVNLANVNTITLGFGNRTNPVAGGVGMVFFDDIRLYRPAQ